MFFKPIFNQPTSNEVVKVGLVSNLCLWKLTVVNRTELERHTFVCYSLAYCSSNISVDSKADESTITNVQYGLGTINVDGNNLGKSLILAQLHGGMLT